MPHINLLPWREELRQERKKQFLTILALALLATAGVVYLALSQVQGMVSHQESRNQMLQREITQLEEKIREIDELRETRADLIARMQVIEELQQQRTEIVHLFDELVKTLPEGVYLTSLKQAGGNISVEGVAQSNACVSAYMKNLDESEWLDDPQLQVIETRGERPNRYSQFSLQVRQSVPAEDKTDAEEAS
jgi:type IV pilus assembly protein PilN